MTLRELLKRALPVRVQRLCWHIVHPLERRTAKHGAELRFWEDAWERSGHAFTNSHYERLMLAMAGEEGMGFLRDKVVADFGCGPKGSLCWASGARLRIGIDVLADAYSRMDIRSHSMCYVWAEETRIPLPSGYADILFTVNAMDHVRHFPATCAELLRILAAGGELIGSFNLGARPTLTEPQQLTEAIVNRYLLGGLQVTRYRIAPIGPENDCYAHCFSEETPPLVAGARILWVRARKATP